MKKKIGIYVFSFLMMGSFLTGCSTRRMEKNVIQENPYTGEIQEQTATTGISQKTILKAMRNGEEALVSGTYYVVHKNPDTVDKKGNIVTGEEIYYPLYSYLNNYDSDEPGDYVNSSRMEFFTTENETEIPTLFLNQGDRLVYYSTTSLLDYIVWERYYDMKYTIGVHDIQSLTNGRVYINLEDDDVHPILQASELAEIYSSGVSNVLLDKIGGHQITSDMVDHGILVGATKSRQYDLEVYYGTYYQHFLTTANTHAFHAYELFASVDYLTLQDYLYEIQIPEYFVTGYYKVNNAGMVRIVKEDSFSEETDFNEQLLFLPEKKDVYDYLSNRDTLFLYSEFPPLNKFETNIEGALGYVSENEDQTLLEETEEEESKEVVLLEAIVKEMELYFPADTECTVTVVSPSKEASGDCYITIGNGVYKLNYDALLGEYSRTIQGKDQIGTLTISGFFEDVNCSLTGCMPAEERPMEEVEENMEQQEESSSQIEEETTEETTEETEPNVRRR